MKNVKQRLTPIVALGLVAVLASCTPPSNSGKGSTTPSSVPAVSSSEPKDVIVHGQPEDFKTGSLTLHFKNNAINEGNSFYDGCMPSLKYGETDRSDRATYVITNREGYEFDPGAPLKEGTYRVRAAYSTYYTTGQFKVVKTTYTNVDTGEGYSQISSEEALHTRLENWDYVGALGNGKMQSIGNPHLLVIPVAFQDTSFSGSEIADLRKAYFGEAEETGWESLSSYYKKSSYGKLDITGTVTSTFKYSQTSQEFENDFVKGSKDTTTIANAAIEWVKTKGIDLKEYDNNHDGFLDGVELIYKSTRSTANNSTLWWCFTTTVSPIQKKGDTDEPVLNRYFWSLSSQQRNHYYSPDIDAHTLIHESGHMLGLNDYYTYGSSDNPCGFVDMMDHNVGDHCAYSKYMLGWVTPKYIDGSKDLFTVTLNDFTSTGDCLIVRNTSDDPWNRTPYDEYLMLEYVTPTGVNEKDSHGYPEWMFGQGNKGTGGTFAKPGLRVSHIDNRLIQLVGDQVDETNYTVTNPRAIYSDTLTNIYGYGTDGKAFTPSHQISSNTSSASAEVINGGLFYDSVFRENSLIAPNGDDDDFNGNYAVVNMGAQSHLFGLSTYDCGGDFYSSYTSSTFFSKKIAWNDGSQLNYSFSVIAQDDASITLRFYKNF